MSIDGVRTIPLARIVDERGSVLHMLRADAAHFESFGEIYFSEVKSGAVKAWHLHSRMTLNLAVPAGSVRLVLYDERPGSPSRGSLEEFVLGPESYQLVIVPPGVWSGFQGLGSGPALVVNCASIPHDESEVTRLPPEAPAIPYRWPAVEG